MCVLALQQVEVAITSDTTATRDAVNESSRGCESEGRECECVRVCVRMWGGSVGVCRIWEAYTH